MTRDSLNECNFIHLAKLTIKNSFDENKFYQKCFNDKKLRLRILQHDKNLAEIFGDQFWDEFCRNPQAIVKQANSKKRCGDWRKFKCKMEYLANEFESQFVSQRFLRECLKFKNYNEEYFDENTREMDCQQWYEDLRIPNADGSEWCGNDQINPNLVVIDLPSLEILQTSVSKFRSYFFRFQQSSGITSVFFQISILFSVHFIISKPYNATNRRHTLLNNFFINSMPILVTVRGF